MLSIRIVKYSKLFIYKERPNVLFGNRAHALSTQISVQSTSEDKYEKQLKDFETLSSVTRKIKPKKPQKPPFAKNLFLGVFDTDILTYPQLEKDEVESLESDVASVEKLIGQNHMINCTTLSNKNFRQNLSDYKVIGLQAPQLMDGRNCYVTESSRFLETVSSHKLRDNIIYNEQLGVQALVKFGSDQLKKKYLHPIMKGDCLSAFCMSESELSELSSIRTKAVLSEDKKTWVLNGDKSWVVNGISSDILLVVAMTDLIVRDIIKEPKITVFVVERNSPGISCTEVKTDGIEMANIHFDNTPIPNENIVGEVNKAEVILAPLITEFRLSLGPACIGVTKKILNELSRNILQQSNDSNLLYKTDAISGKIGEITTDLYAMESVLYLTTGLIDSYENQDCELESLIVKIFCAQSCLNASITALDLTGLAAISQSHWANSLHKEALHYLFLHETNDNLKIMAALFGLQFAGFKLNDRINKIRNPLFHAGFTLRRMWINRKNMEDDPKLDLQLGDYLHPSLLMGAHRLEYSLKRLEFATEILLARFGSDVISQHMDLRRLGDCIIDIYVMAACLGRSSRSYCIGLQHADQEIMIASTFCSAAMERVKERVKKIYQGEYLTNDENYRSISKQIFKSKSYFLKHPLSRNF